MSIMDVNSFFTNKALRCIWFWIKTNLPIYRLFFPYIPVVFMQSLHLALWSCGHQFSGTSDESLNWFSQFALKNEDLRKNWVLLDILSSCPWCAFSFVATVIRSFLSRLSLFLTGLCKNCFGRITVVENLDRKSFLYICFCA